MTSCTGVLKEAVKLILDLSIMQLGVLTASHFLGGVFGVLRFLGGLCSFCGQQLGIGFGIAISKAVLYVLKGGRISRSSLSAVLLPMCCGGAGDVLQLFGIHSVMPESVMNSLFCWRNWLGKHGSDTWNFIPGCLMWIVRKEQNHRSFDNSESSLDRLKSVFHRTLFDWSRLGFHLLFFHFRFSNFP